MQFGSFLLLVGGQKNHHEDKMSGRWIGFDMDECIGSVMPLFVFLHSIPLDAVVTHVLPALLRSEMLGETWIFRKSILNILPVIWEAYRSDEILGCFIFSNNGSQLHFACLFLNCFLQKTYNLPRNPAMFKMGIWHGAPCRPRGYAKNIAAIQHSLAAHDLPGVCGDGLLFFDDMDHELRDEIGHYVRVPAYRHYTPIERVVLALSDVGGVVGGVVGPPEWSQICRRASTLHTKDLADHSNRYIYDRPVAGDVLKETALFRAAIRRFIGKK